MSKFKVVELVRTQKKDLRSNELVLELSGTGINNAVVNGLVRSALNDVPTYAFPPERILIEENTSVFDNDEMRNRLEQLRIPNVDVPVQYLKLDYWLNADYTDPDRELHPDDNMILEFVVNKTNDTDKIMNVTTNDLQCYINGEEDDTKFNKDYPQLIIKLKPTQSFICSARGVLGCGQAKDIWSAASNAFLSTEDEKTYKLTVRSAGQIDEYQILINCCVIAKSKFKDLREKIEQEDELVKMVEKEKEMHLLLNHETFTIPNIINNALQDHPDTVYSGVSKPDWYKNEMLIKFTTSKANPLKTLFSVLDDLHDFYDKLEKEFVKMAK